MIDPYIDNMKSVSVYEKRRIGNLLRQRSYIKVNDRNYKKMLTSSTLGTIKYNREMMIKSSSHYFRSTLKKLSKRANDDMYISCILNPSGDGIKSFDTMQDVCKNVDYDSQRIDDEAYEMAKYELMEDRKRMNSRLSGTMGSIVYGAKGIAEAELIRIAVDSVKRRYGEELYLFGDQQNGLNDWIKVRDKKFENRSKDNYGNIMHEQFIMPLEKQTFAYIATGNKVNRLDSFRINSSETNNSAAVVYIFGRHYKKHIKELKDHIKVTKSGNLYKYNVSGYRDKERGTDNMNSVVSDLNKRDIDTLFFEDGIKEAICSHIDTFLNNKDVYESRSLNHKTGILLYGEPGTGKTSLTTALANKYNHSLIVIDMNSFDSLDINSLKSCVDADNDNFIILLEDIDTLYTSLDREKNIDFDEKKIVNKMLQFLDSSSSPSDVIFIATTNDINVLDTAITRDGRFDLKVEVGPINKKVAKEMVMSFGIKASEADEIIKHLPNRINQSKLQNIILNYFKEHVFKEVTNNEEDK